MKKLKDLFINFKQLPISLKVTIVISFVVFIISLTQPAFYIDRKEDPNAYSESLPLFLLGWMSFLGGALVPFVIWLANPIYFISVFLTIQKNKLLGFFYSLVSNLLALIFSLLNTIMTSESGSFSKITGRGLGFKLWFTSFIILTLGLGINLIISRKRNNPNSL